MIRRRVSPILILASLIMGVIVLLGWWMRGPLHAFASGHPALYPAIFLGASLLNIAFAGVHSLESAGLKRTWLARIAVVADLEGLRPLGIWESVSRFFPDIFEIISRPLLETSFGRRLAAEWSDADLGDKASRYLMLLLLFAGGGFWLGSRVGGFLLALALFMISPMIPRAFVRSRAERCRQRFSEQLPHVLDGLASGLSAGLSFDGAVDYVQAELAEPSKSIFKRLSHRLALGIPIQEALLQLQREASDEALNLVVDGLILQRQFGGDMVGMLTETAGLLLERIELEREVRAITTQGRLSGMIIAVLVPVSAGFLLAFNPRYIDVLFDNVLGQALVILALALQLTGWAIISRLVRIAY